MNELVNYIKPELVIISEKKKLRDYEIEKIFNNKDKSLLAEIEEIGEGDDAIQQLFNSHLNEDIPFGDIFDTAKLAFYNANKPIFTENCTKEMYFLYNKETLVFEPFNF